MLQLLITVFLAGVLNRITDMAADDGLKLGALAGSAAAAVYGYLLAFVIAGYPLLAPLGMGIIISVVLTGKINHRFHHIGLGSFLLFAIVIGIRPVDIFHFSVFVLAGLMDELGNSIVDGVNKRVSGWRLIPYHFFRIRLTVEAAVLALGVITGEWVFLPAVLAYDAGFTYIFPLQVRNRLIKLSG